MAERSLKYIHPYDNTEEEVTRAANVVRREADSDALLDILGLV